MSIKKDIKDTLDDIRMAIGIEETIPERFKKFQTKFNKRREERGRWRSPREREQENLTPIREAIGRRIDEGSLLRLPTIRRDRAIEDRETRDQTNPPPNDQSGDRVREQRDTGGIGTEGLTWHRGQSAQSSKRAM